MKKWQRSGTGVGKFKSSLENLLAADDKRLKY